MKLTKNGYKDRLIDEKINHYLNLFGAISLEGSKWCGKTWTALNHSNSVVYLNSTENNSNDKELALMNVNLVMKKDAPELIDEWQEVPKIWDAVRFECDQDSKKGKYILTGSATPRKEAQEEIHHSGAGRICKMKMYTMSLYESGDSTGNVSITNLFKNNVKDCNVKGTSLEKIANLIVKGGWPGTQNMSALDSQIIVKSYIDAVLDKDMNEVDEVKRDRNKMEMLMKSLARNESAISSNKKIIEDIKEFSKKNLSRNTIRDYLNVLSKLHLIENQESYSYKIRSSKNIGKISKRHYTDPSFGCALLNITPEKLINDLNTFGFYFEALVERDLRIYMDYLGGRLCHYRENDTGVEVDAILELESGEYAAIEIKLGTNGIEEGKKSLLRFYNLVDIKPKFMAIICGLANAVVKDPETGIYILPITALKP